MENLAELAAKARYDKAQLNWAGLIHCQLGRPVLFLGMFGEGKTTTAHLLAKMTSRYYANLSLTQYDAEALGGYLSPTSRMVDGSEVRFVELLPIEQVAMCKVRPSVMLLDELGSVDERKQAAALKLLCSEEGEFKDCWMIGAGNPPDVAAYGHDLSLPATNRMMILDWEFDLNAHQEGSRNRHQFPNPSIPIVPDRSEWEPNIDYWGGLKAAFVDGGGRFRSGADDETCKLEEGKPFTTPRSWTFFEEFGAAAMAVGASNNTIDKGMDGLLGSENAAMFREFISKQDLPDPDAILASPRSFRLPHRPDLARATFSAIGNKLRSHGTVETWEAACDFVEANYEANREWCQMWLSELYKLKPDDHTPDRRNGMWRTLIEDRVKISEIRA